MLKQIIKLGGILCAITLITVFLLGFVNNITKETIAENREKAETEAKAELVFADSFDEISDGIYEGKKDGKTEGYCVKSSSKGYGGDVVMLVGFDKDLKVLGIKILQSSETAGLGSKAASPEFSEALKGKIAPLTVNRNGTGGEREVDAISGATITTNAVTEAINTAFDRLSKEVGAK